MAKPEIEIPTPTKESNEPRILVVDTDQVPTEQVRDATLDGHKVVIETTNEALTEIRNDLKEIKTSLIG